MSISQSNRQRIAERHQRFEHSQTVNNWCSAKWLQSTVHLGHGATHSCHHPSRHAIPSDLLAQDPSVLTNTPWIQQQRALMSQGKRVSECQYCWTIEDAGHVSDRIIKTADTRWSQPHLDRTQNTVSVPSYLEVSWGNSCQQKCMYCGPNISTAWAQELETLGAWDDFYHEPNLNTPPGDSNPWIDAWWRWWPDISGQVQVLRMTGGEPLLMRDTWKMLGWLWRNPQPHLTVSVNTNLTVKSSLIDRLLDWWEKLQGRVNSFDIYTSAEATGSVQEWTRWGMNWQVFNDVCHRVLSRGIDLHVMSTTNALSLVGLPDFLSWILNLRREYNQPHSHNRITMNLNVLREPDFMSIMVMPQHVVGVYIDRVQSIMRQNLRHTSNDPRARFYGEEVEHLDRTLALVGQGDIRLQKRLARFIRQHDLRRGTDFINQIPALFDWYADIWDIDND